MIVSPDVERYLASLDAPAGALEAEMAAHGERDGVPIVVPETARLLDLVARLVGARRAVEVGTAIGVSTLALARAVGAGGTVVSFDVDAGRQSAAAGYLERAGVADRVDLRLEDAREGLGRLDAPFDVAFVDGVKDQYPAYLDGVLPLLRPGAVVLVDNMLMSGTVATGRSDGHWDDAAIRAMREFTRRLLDDAALKAGTVLAVGDGVGIAIRR